MPAHARMFELRTPVVKGNRWTSTLQEPAFGIHYQGGNGTFLSLYKSPLAVYNYAHCIDLAQAMHGKPIGSRISGRLQESSAYSACNGPYQRLG